MAYRNGHILIAGFTQRVGRRSNGLYELFDSIYREWAGPETLVEYFPWYLNPRDLADTISRRSCEALQVHGQRMRWQLVGYSFGGQTVAHVCQRLHESRVTVDAVTLCDPVARRGRLGWLKAANPFGRIRIDSNVNRLAWVRQSNPRWQPRLPLFFPAGHDLAVADGVELVGPFDRRVEHTDIDSDGLFHELVIDQAEQLHRQDQIDQVVG